MQERRERHPHRRQNRITLKDEDGHRIAFGEALDVRQICRRLDGDLQRHFFPMQTSWQQRLRPLLSCNTRPQTQRPVTALLRIHTTAAHVMHATLENERGLRVALHREALP